MTVQPAAGAIVFDSARRLLVVRRGRPPAAGLWSVPGGKCGAGESLADACAREVAEETGLSVAVLRAVGRIERSGPAGVTYDITDFDCRLLGGTLQAGDDASDARWVTRADFDTLDLVPGLVECLTQWARLPD
jgi:ADP-ribose pyrophosphatase YjhB (NUDIX family)